MWMLMGLLMGWPAILGSLGVSVYGVVSRQARFLVAGAALSLGFAWYLTMSPGPIFKFLGLLIPSAHILAGLAVGRRWPGLAWLLLLPHMGTAGYLAAVVLSQ